MPKPRTPEDACVEYAIAVFHVRLQTQLIRENPCEVAAQAFGEFDAAVKSRPGIQNELRPPDLTDCIARHWEIETYPVGDLGYAERPSLAYEDMCDGCQQRLKAILDRKEARKRLGAAKRSVEAVGKRLDTSVAGQKEEKNDAS